VGTFVMLHLLWRNVSVFAVSYTISCSCDKHGIQLQFCILVTSQYEWKISKRDVKLTSIFRHWIGGNLKIALFFPVTFSHCDFELENEDNCFLQEGHNDDFDWTRNSVRIKYFCNVIIAMCNDCNSLEALHLNNKYVFSSWKQKTLYLCFVIF
jgi:hypothetical protein